MMHRKKQCGAAILAAMVTVALVAVIATAAVQQQWRLTQVEAAERTRQQAAWLLYGAVDWARLLLRQDAQSASKQSVDHLAEPWALPLKETKLSAFLSAQGGVAQADDASADAEAAYLSGDIEDLQAKFNLLSLDYGDGQRSNPKLGKLFELLGLSSTELAILEQGLQESVDKRLGRDRRLQPQRIEDLTWLGVSAATVHALKPYVSFLPQGGSVNLNTASAVVIAAVAEMRSLEDAQVVVVERNSKHFDSLEQAHERLKNLDVNFSANDFGVSSQAFSARGQLRMNDLALAMSAQLMRAGVVVSTQQVHMQGAVLE